MYGRITGAVCSSIRPYPTGFRKGLGIATVSFYPATAVAVHRHVIGIGDHDLVACATPIVIACSTPS